MNPEEAFQKQRRNLILFSTIVLFMNLAEAEIKKISILGNEVDIKNPQVAATAFLLALIYISIRYIQYMHGVQNKQIKDNFETQIKEAVMPRLFRRVFFSRYENKKIAKAEIEKYKIHHFHMLESGMPKMEAYISFRGKSSDVDFEYPKEKLSAMEMLWPYTRATLYVLFRTHLITEYAFPLIYAGFAYLSFSKKAASYVVGLL